MKKTKKQQVLEMLRRSAGSGVHSFDGAYAISYRFAAYIGFLKNDGYQIKSVSEKRRGCRGVRYYLIEEEPMQESFL